MLELPDEKPVLQLSSGVKDVFASLLSTSDVSLVGLNSGIPTRTTPTLTPTTLRNIDQTCLEIQVESHQNQARFVPPVVPSNQGILMNVVDMKRWQGGSTRISDARPVTCNTLISSNKSTPGTPTKRNTGGRKPIKDLDMTPEELERKIMRRERNKMAAARCRKRRLDHTNELIGETDELQEKKNLLQEEIQRLQMQKKELEFILESHKPCCRLHPPNSPPDIKPTLDENGYVVSALEAEIIVPDIIHKKPLSFNLNSNHNNVHSKPEVNKRPDSLPVFPGHVTAEGIPPPTPNASIPFNFDSLMEGGTGLTPVSGPLIPSCSTQQRNADLSSPDSNKLVSL